MQKRSESNDADVARKRKLDEIECGLKRLADRLELEWGKLPPPTWRPGSGRVTWIRGGLSPASQLLKRAAVDAGRLLVEGFKLDLLPKVRDVAQLKEVVKLPGDHFEQAFQVLRDDWLPLFGVSKPSSDLGAGYAFADSIRAMASALLSADVPKRRHANGRKGKAGRPRIEGTKEERDLKLYDDWQTAKGADTEAKVFCKDKGITIAELDRIVAWVGTRRRRGQV